MQSESDIKIATKNDEEAKINRQQSPPLFNPLQLINPQKEQKRSYEAILIEPKTIPGQYNPVYVINTEIAEIDKTKLSYEQAIMADLNIYCQ